MPEVAILVSSYQRPLHLLRSLISIAMQEGVADAIEVVVTDDGSTDNTKEVVERFAANARFPVKFTTHPHQAFQLARCRNEGVAASNAPYLLFLDGDCILPPDHVAQHLRRRQEGVVWGGYCVHLDETVSQRITPEIIRSGDFLKWAPPGELRKLAKMDRKARLYNFLRHPTKPKLFGGNIGIHRSDYERVNGYDESFEGWGCEDDDLRVRLRQAGIKIKSILRDTHTWHLWHPPTPSKPGSWREGANVARHRRRSRLTRCLNGLHKRGINELRLRVVGRPERVESANSLLAAARIHELNQEDAEVEVLFLPGNGAFSGKADCNVLVVLGDAPEADKLARRADVTISDQHRPRQDTAASFPLAEFERALRAVA